MSEDDDGSGGFIPDKPYGIGDVVRDLITIAARRAPVTALVERDDGPVYFECWEKNIPVRPVARDAVEQ
jgi:hypothetical protein